MIRCHHGTSIWTYRRAMQAVPTLYSFVTDDNVPVARRVELYPNCETCKAEFEYEEALRVLQAGKA